MAAQTNLQTPLLTHRGFLQWLLGFSIVATLAGASVPIIGYLWPPRPLPSYELAVKDGKVYVGKPLGQIYGT